MERGGILVVNGPTDRFGSPVEACLLVGVVTCFTWSVMVTFFGDVVACFN